MDWRQPCVYILASEPNGTLYVGVTSDPVKRIWHTGRRSRFARTSVHTLVWYELHQTMDRHPARERLNTEAGMDPALSRARIPIGSTFIPACCDRMIRAKVAFARPPPSPSPGAGRGPVATTDHGHWIPACAGMTIKSRARRHSPSPRRRPGSSGDHRPLMPLDTSLRWYDDQEQARRPLPSPSPRRRPGSSGDHRPLMPLDTSLRWYDDQEQSAHTPPRHPGAGRGPVAITHGWVPTPLGPCLRRDDGEGRRSASGFITLIVIPAKAGIQ